MCEHRSPRNSGSCQPVHHTLAFVQVHRIGLDSQQVPLVAHKHKHFHKFIKTCFQLDTGLFHILIHFSQYRFKNRPTSFENCLVMRFYIVLGKVLHDTQHNLPYIVPQHRLRIHRRFHEPDEVPLSQHRATLQVDLQFSHTLAMGVALESIQAIKQHVVQRLRRVCNL